MTTVWLYLDFNDSIHRKKTSIIKLWITPILLLDLQNNMTIIICSVPRSTWWWCTKGPLVQPISLDLLSLSRRRSVRIFNPLVPKIFEQTSFMFLLHVKLHRFNGIQNPPLNINGFGGIHANAVTMNRSKDISKVWNPAAYCQRDACPYAKCYQPTFVKRMGVGNRNIMTGFA